MTRRLPEELSPFAFILGGFPDPPALKRATAARAGSLDDVDEAHLWRAAAAAWQGVGRTGPNPPVGAVLARGARVLGVGHHERAGGPHAEVRAFDDAGRGKARGATLYVTLEPCNHTGKTGPCTERILEERVARVVIGVKDPHPLVSGRGMARLRRAGVDVEVRKRGEAARLCRALIAPFASTHTRRRPYVVAKVAASLDGKVAAPSGHARWVTGAKARAAVHALRARVDAVLVGAGTVLADDPELTVRDVAAGSPSRSPRRIVVDGALRVPPTARVYRRVDGEKGRPLVLHGEGAPAAARRALDEQGVERLAFASDRVPLREALSALAEHELHALLVEPGPGLFGAVAPLVDEVWWMTAPTLVGADGVAAFPPRGIAAMDEAFDLAVRAGPLRLGDDWLTVLGPPAVRGAPPKPRG